MFRFSFRFGACLLALVAGMSLGNSIQAQSVPHKEQSRGQVFNVTATTMDFVSTGHGTHYGKYTEAGSHFYFADGTLVGAFTVTTADGSTMSGIYYGTYGDLGGGFTGFDVTVEWLTGTGRLEGVTGIGNASAYMENATGLAGIDASGLWDRP